MSVNAELLSQILEDLQKKFDLSVGAIEDIFSRAVVNNIKQNTLVLKQGVKSLVVFFIIQGKAEVIKDGVRLAEVKPGDIIGEMSILGKGKASATVRALSDMVVYKFRKDKFNVVLNKYQSLNKAIVMEVINRKNEQDDIAEEYL